MAHGAAHDHDEYWAMFEGDDLVAAMIQRIQDYYEDLENTGLYSQYLLSFRAYNGGNLSPTKYEGGLFDSSRIEKGGEVGEVSEAKCNHYRSLVSQSVNLVTSTRPAIHVLASNTDSESQSQCILGQQLVDYYMRNKNYETKYRRGFEFGYLYGKGSYHQYWKKGAGKVYEDIDGQKIHEGDACVEVHTPLSIIVDIELSDDDEHDWKIVRSYESRWDLIAEHPELREDLLGVNFDLDFYARNSFTFDVRSGKMTRKYRDRVPVFTLYHRRTQAMPGGLYCKIVGDVIVEQPQDIPYAEIPIYEVFAGRIDGTPHAYSAAWDILGPQAIHDRLTTTITTNQSNGMNKIWTQRNDSVSVEQLKTGMTHLQSAVKPETLSLVNTPVEIFNFRTGIEHEMEKLMGISQVLRGEPLGANASGASLAMYVSQSVQFANLVESEGTLCLEKLMSGLLVMLREFSRSPRVLSITGDANRPFLKEFTNKDLSEINRCECERVNPMVKTISGRVQLGDNLLERQAITINQYLTLLQTGRLDHAISGSVHDEIDIKASIEAIRRGEEVPAIITDNHPERIRQYLTIIGNPETRADEAMVSRVLDVVNIHIDLWYKLDPALAVVLKIPPPPPRPQPMMPGQQGAGGPGGPGGPGPMGPPPGPQNPQAEMMNDPAGPVSPDQMPNMPNMPSLPENADPGTQGAFEKMQANLQ